ncbi:hypothetical protein [Schlesneria paludicola]|uniref:hypothetical protein n=1 Tax=Schlesneria paludicola TaxID=360056 RepID=UPI000299E753|nr:hypothetical protein [Schlesneria paludicola]
MQTSELHIPSRTFEQIKDLVESSREAKGSIDVVNIPGDPDKRLFIVKPDSTYEVFEPGRTPRSSQLLSVDQIPVFVQHAIGKWEADPVVYYNAKNVIVRLVEDNLRFTLGGTALVNLSESPQLKIVKKYAESPDSAWLPHKAFVSLLRINLSDCIDDKTLDSLVKALTRLQFDSGTRVASQVARNRESLGRDVIAEVKSLDDIQIPEEVVLRMRLFTDPALQGRQAIVCKLETDPTNGRLALLPMANQIEDALDREMSNLGDLLRTSLNSRTIALPDPTGEGLAPVELPKVVPVFYGTP